MDIAVLQEALKTAFKLVYNTIYEIIKPNTVKDFFVMDTEELFVDERRQRFQLQRWHSTARWSPFKVGTFHLAGTNISW